MSDASVATSRSHVGVNASVDEHPAGQVSWPSVAASRSQVLPAVTHVPLWPVHVAATSVAAPAHVASTGLATTTAENTQSPPPVLEKSPGTAHAELPALSAQAAPAEKVHPTATQSPAVPEETNAANAEQGLPEGATVPVQVATPSLVPVQVAALLVHVCGMTVASKPRGSPGTP